MGETDTPLHELFDSLCGLAQTLAAMVDALKVLQGELIAAVGTDDLHAAPAVAGTIESQIRPQ